MIIDVHTHIGLLRDPEYSESHKKNLNLLLAEAKKNAVNHVIVLALPELKGGDNSGISTENALKLTVGHKNISVIAGVDINYQKNDLAQLEAWVKSKAVVGIKFYTGYQHYYPKDERCLPLYALALKYDIPVMFHSGDTLSGYVKNPKVKYSHPIHIDEVAADFPSLKIIIAHLGNPWIIDCAEVLYKNKNVYADISGLVLGGNFDTPLGELTRKRLQELLIYAEGNKLLYGTDWPLCRMNPYLTFVRGLGLSQEETNKIFYKNAVDVFHM